MFYHTHEFRLTDGTPARLHPQTGMISLPNNTSVREFIYDGRTYRFHRNSKRVGGKAYSGRNRREFLPIESIGLGYKLTNQDCTTTSDCLWGENLTHTASGEGDLCTAGWLHYYDHPLLAALMNPIHANISNPILWECKIEGKIKTDKGLKSGCTKLTTLRTIPLPAITSMQKIRFAIFCAKKVYDTADWNLWATDWLSGKNRSADAAARAANATVRAAYAAARAAYAAARAADAADSAADAAAYAATYAAYSGGKAARATNAAAYAAYAAEAAAFAAVFAAEAAADGNINFIAIAEKAMLEER